MRAFVVLLITASSFLLARAATAQTTQCQWVGNVWTCNQQRSGSSVQWQNGVMPDIGGNAMRAVEQGREQRRQEERARLEAERLAAERDYYRSQTQQTSPTRSQRIVAPQSPSTAQSPQGLDSYDTGNGLLATCQSEQWPVCLAFIRGVTQAFAGGLKVAGAAQSYCIPPTATMGQTQDVTVKWLIDHPAARHQSADVLVVTALIAAFPC